jgi:hypothetical protein
VTSNIARFFGAQPARGASPVGRSLRSRLMHSADDLAAVAGSLNSRPHKTLGWRTPAEALNDHPLSPHAPSVASIP